ncbi:D-serine ammonia-lyase [Alkalihalobacillus clausii]|uniref:D-serine ammonia-lyase n=1 Tax=Shouchella clausii TaxID=79880 RepID=UPI002041AF68|nr:D-serine ammonia-lyase [Shouchella clausii]
MDIAGKNREQWLEAYPLLQQIGSTKEVWWANPNKQPASEGLARLPLKEEDVKKAEQRLRRFAPYIASVFPETKGAGGLIESPLIDIATMKHKLEQRFGQSVPGRLLLKGDHALPISGSIKARGGIYEVLKHAESLLVEQQILTKQDDYSLIATDATQSFFSSYAIVVGSTGNLGLSIGIISAKLGFRVTVHMSADAKQWKKDMLREKGVRVVEHSADYSKAVEEGRKESDADPNSYFIDDEHSIDLFVGYAVAAFRLKEQLQEKGIAVTKDQPLHVYLPCGVGGGPGGVAFGLKLVFGDAVRCFFAEPTHSPCMLIGMLTGKHHHVSVQDFGIDNQTAADGLAVGRPSGFVGRMMAPLLEGIYTIADSMLYTLLADLADAEGLYLEPSAVAGLYGPVQLEKRGLYTGAATHLVWATGGSMVPKEVMETDYQIGVNLRTEQ